MPAESPNLGRLVKMAMLDKDAGITAEITIVSFCLGVGRASVLHDYYEHTPARISAWNSICNLSFANFKRYAETHAYGLRYFTKPFNLGVRSIHWIKIPLLISVTVSSGVKFAFWTDADSLFLNNMLPINPVLPAENNVISFAPWGKGCISSGQMGFTTGKASIELLHDVWDIYPPPYYSSIMHEQASFIYLMGNEEKQGGFCANLSCCALGHGWRGLASLVLNPLVGNPSTITDASFMVTFPGSDPIWRVKWMSIFSNSEQRLRLRKIFPLYKTNFMTGWLQP